MAAGADAGPAHGLHRAIGRRPEHNEEALLTDGALFLLLPQDFEHKAAVS